MVILIVFVVLKLTGVVAWSWWWVTSPLWIGFVGLVLLASGLFILWCLLWCLGHILMSLFRRRVRRQLPWARETTL